MHEVFFVCFLLIPSRQHEHTVGPLEVREEGYIKSRREARHNNVQKNKFAKPRLPCNTQQEQKNKFKHMSPCGVRNSKKCSSWRSQECSDCCALLDSPDLPPPLPLRASSTPRQSPDAPRDYLEDSAWTLPALPCDPLNSIPATGLSRQIFFRDEQHRFKNTVFTQFVFGFGCSLVFSIFVAFPGYCLSSSAVLVWGGGERGGMGGAVCACLCLVFRSICESFFFLPEEAPGCSQQTLERFVCVPSHPILVWSVRHAGWLLTRFQVVTSGKTAHCSLYGRQYSGEVGLFGETVFYMFGHRAGCSRDGRKAKTPA